MIMSYIEPTGEQIKDLVEMDVEGPLVMLNLLKFKPAGGRESYQKYGQGFNEVMKNVDVKIHYAGDFLMPLIGEEKWDMILLVEYPSKQAFLDMAANPEYRKAAENRTAALTDSRLYVTKGLPGNSLE
jgi:uncharacterized protein (DUF1330 family)